MPTIQTLPKKQKPPRKETDMRKLRQKAYNNTEWRKLRNTFIKEHPLCEECLRHGKVTAAHDVHHKKSPFINGEINYSLLLDENNLESICQDCHGKEHGHKITAVDMLKVLDELLGDED